jgi:hypothetical protein
VFVERLPGHASGFGANRIVVINLEWASSLRSGDSPFARSQDHRILVYASHGMGSILTGFSCAVGV